MDAQLHAQYAFALIKTTVTETLKNEPVKIYLFGSRANATANRYSDFDIGILPKGNYDLCKLNLLRELMEDLPIPYSVDIVNLSTVSEIFLSKVISEGQLWKP